MKMRFLCLILILFSVVLNGNNLNEKVTLFLNGTVLTVDEDMTIAQAVAVKGSKIISVGTNEEVVRFLTPDAEIVNLKGKTLMPGFIEVHSHPFLKMVVENATVDIRPAVGFTDGEEVMKIIKETIAKAEPGEYLVFFGWDPLLQKGAKNPSRKELDALAPQNPVFIWGNSVHVGFANTLAFEAAGIDKNTPNPTGAMAGTFEHDEDGELQGRVDQGGAVGMVILPYLMSSLGTPQNFAQALYQGWLVNAKDGVTTISDNVLEKDILAMYRLTATLHSTLRIRGYAINFKAFDTSKDDDMIALTGGKLFVDGSPWTGTITMTAPYLVNDTTLHIMDTPAGYYQEPYVSQEELQQFIDDVLSMGLSACIHAEGDGAIDVALDAIEMGLEKNPVKDHRIRLEHVPMMRDDQFERAHRLAVPVSFLMAHVRYWGDVIPELVGDERGQRWCPVNSAIQHGVSYTFHFDGPTSPNKPLETLQTVTTRMTVGGNVLGPEQRITLDQAIRGYTINAAYQLFMEDIVGSIEVGKYADMIILNENPYEVALDEISQIKVLATYINGEVFWEED
ncbi:MAG TPA: amidohydrolase [Thermotogota bacterium]|nr:amidohydrolase [Thermotogota bacterium]